MCVLIFACKKNQLGGKSKVSGEIKHHSKLIPDADVYIKFNATDFPGEDLSVYDTHIKANDKGYYEITNFYKGNYYLFAVGKDYSIPPPYKVIGGIAVKLRDKEELIRNIAITEGD